MNGEPVSVRVQRIAQEIGGTTIAMVVGFGVFIWIQALVNLSLLADDLARILPPRSERANGLRLGRWVHYYVNQIAFDIPYAHSFTGTFVVVAFAALALVIAHKAGLHRRRSLLLVFTALAVANPVIVESIVFKLHHLPIGLGVFMAALTALLLPHLDATERTPLPHLAIAGGTLVISLASYQGIIPMLVTGLVGVSMIRYVQSDDPDRVPLRLRPVLEIIATFFVAAIVYVISFKVTVRIGSDRGSYSDKYDPAATRLSWGIIKRELDRLYHFWYDASFTYPQWVKWLTIVVAAIALSVSIGHTFRTVAQQRSKRLGAAYLVVAMVAIHFLPFIILFLRVEPIPRYNVIMGVSMVPAIVFVLFFVAVVDRRSKEVRRRFSIWAMVAVVLILGTFGTTISRSLTAVELGQQRNLSLATRILSRVEEQPGYLDLLAHGPLTREVEIVFLGNFTRPSVRFPLPQTNDGWTTITSCVGPPCRVIRLADNMSLLSLDGTRFMTTSKSRKFFEKNPPDMGNWPRPDSVKFIDGVVVVKGTRGSSEREK